MLRLRYWEQFINKEHFSCKSLVLYWVHAHLFCLTFQQPGFSIYFMDLVKILELGKKEQEPRSVFLRAEKKTWLGNCCSRKQSIRLFRFPIRNLFLLLAAEWVLFTWQRINFAIKEQNRFRIVQILASEALYHLSWKQISKNSLQILCLQIDISYILCIIMCYFAWFMQLYYSTKFKS